MASGLLDAFPGISFEALLDVDDLAVSKWGSYLNPLNILVIVFAVFTWLLSVASNAMLFSEDLSIILSRLAFAGGIAITSYLALIISPYLIKRHLARSRASHVRLVIGYVAAKQKAQQGREN
jgi:hypothetical protein